MKKLKYFGAAFLSVALCAGFVSCGNDDDDDDINSGVVTPDIPSQEGWNNVTTDGIMKYVVNTPDYDDEEFGSYFAFDMSAGHCTEASYSVVFENERQAKQIAQMLTSGSWAEGDDDDDDYDYAKAPGSTAARKISGLVNAFDVAKAIKSARATRSTGFVIPCHTNGRVVYVMINNFYGTDVDDIRDVVNYWDENGYYNTPDRIIFGDWNRSTGIYTLSDVMGLGIDYKVTTTWNANGSLNTYATEITCPTGEWASLMYDMFKEMEPVYEEMFGKAPVVSVNGRTVKVDAFIIGEVSMEEVESLLAVYDWTLSRPFFYDIFE